MSVIEKKEFITKIASKDNAIIRITGVQNGKFILMADLENNTYIYSNKKGQHIEFKKVEDILRILQIDTLKTKIQLEIKNWVGT